MATLYPELSEERLSILARRTRGEADFYRACRDQLDDAYLVIHSLPIVRRRSDGAPEDGDSDFLIAHPDSGILAVEVKTDRVDYDARLGVWKQFNSVKGTTRNLPHSPFEQAKDSKHHVIKQMKQDPQWKTQSMDPPRGHAAFFWDVSDVEPFVQHDRARVFIGGQGDRTRIQAWFHDAMQASSGADSRPLGLAGIELIKALFCRSIQGSAELVIRLRGEAAKQIELTEQQGLILRALRKHHQALISGGAGTGKTQLAFEHARSLARAGKPTLLVCVNEALAAHLSTAASGTAGLHVKYFQELCQNRVSDVLAQRNQDLFAEAQRELPHADPYVMQWPYALGRSAEILPDRYDAIVVDEGQDFKDEQWGALLRLLRHRMKSDLYIFYDHNQALYTRSHSLPISGEPYLLTRNCRNTHAIHSCAYNPFFYRGEETEPPPDLPGEPIEALAAQTLPAQAKRLHQQIVTLVRDKGIWPERIAVLIATSRTKREHYDALLPRELPNACTWAEQDHGQAKTILLDTVARFKGLERRVVFLWGLDGLDPHERQELIYVGLSRARSLLYLVGSPSTCHALIHTS